MIPIKHAKVTTSTLQEDGSIKTQTDSYYEELAHTIIKIEKQLPVTLNTLIKEIMTALEPITKEKSPEVNLRIKAKNGEPIQLIKRWVTTKESYNRK